MDLATLLLTTHALLLLLVIGNTGTTSSEQDQNITSTSTSRRGSGSWSPPEFDVSVASTVTVMEGEDALLPCVLTKLKGRTVSWIRKRDLHVIFANGLTFTSDHRFKVILDNNNNNSSRGSSFTLVVAGALRNDSGVYECQVNTRPKLYRPVTLQVLVPSAEIRGAQELFIKRESTLVLTCTALIHPASPSQVTWLHNKSVLSISGGRGGVSVHTERQGPQLASTLSLARVEWVDAGNYTCRPKHVTPALATVYIVDEEVPAAMHHDSGGAWRGGSMPPLTTLLYSTLAALVCPPAPS